jgi:hypothetical protein
MVGQKKWVCGRREGNKCVKEKFHVKNIILYGDQHVLISQGMD